jgi:hypothetical protein
MLFLRWDLLLLLLLLLLYNSSILNSIFDCPRDIIRADYEIVYVNLDETRLCRLLLGLVFLDGCDNIILVVSCGLLEYLFVAASGRS